MSVRLVWRGLWRRPTAMPTYATLVRRSFANLHSCQVPYQPDYYVCNPPLCSQPFREESPNSLTASFRARWITASPMPNCCHRSCVTAYARLYIMTPKFSLLSQRLSGATSSVSSSMLGQRYLVCTNSNSRSSRSWLVLNCCTAIRNGDVLRDRVRNC